VDPTREIVLEHDGVSVPTLVYVAERASVTAPAPAIVLCAEAFGVNDFTREIAAKLAAEGYVVIVPDYYRGHGLSDPEGYHDFTEVMEFIHALDFVGATHDMLAAVEHARSLPEVDDDRIAVWGYCTGGTLALLAACLDRHLAAAVLFFPSQPTFSELSPTRPVQPVDLLWTIACPVMLIYGDNDPVWPPVMADDVRRRLDQWHIEHQINVYPGAGHAFSAPVAPLRHHDADVASWADAVAFVGRHLQSRQHVQNFQETTDAP
jgi:carboxymethylenebutenolidase